MRSKPMVMFLGCLLLLCAPAGAGLEFERQLAEVRAQPGQKQATVEFAFANTGKGALTIQKVETNCDCTAAGADKKTYQPGEKGTIRLQVNIGQRVGTKSWSVEVQTDDPQQPRYVLRVDIHVPELVRLSQKLVSWKQGDNTPRTVRIQIDPAVSIHLTRVSTDQPAVAAELKTIEAGRRYELILTPRADAPAGTVTVSVQSDYPAEEPRVYTIYAKITGR